MTTLDPRLLRVSFEVNGQIRTYDQQLDITVNITKCANALQNEATVNITGMAKDARDHLLTETSPYNANYTRKSILIEGGRQSTGLFTLYQGDVIKSGVTQPPDVVTTLTARTLNFDKTTIVARAFAARTQLSVIAEKIADDLQLSMNFEATDRLIQSFSFTGAKVKLVDRLNECGGINAFVDNQILIVKDANVSRKNIVHTVSEQSGMIGLPELTETGVRVQYMLDPNSQIGGKLTIDSVQNPGLNGDYTIYNLWHVCASRDTAFYTIAECVRPGRIDIAGGFPMLLRQ